MSDIKLYDDFDLKLLELGRLVYCLANRGSNGVFLLLKIFIGVVWRPVLSIAGQLIVSVSPRFRRYRDYLFVFEDSLTS